MGQTPSAALVGGYPETKLLLDSAERAFLTAVRSWVAGSRRDYDPIPGIYRDLDAAGAGGAAFSLNEFLAVVAETASSRSRSTLRAATPALMTKCSWCSRRCWRNRDAWMWRSAAYAG